MCNPPSTSNTPPPPAKNSRSSKSSKSLPLEERLILSSHTALKDRAHEVEIIDTHTHIWSTFQAYRERYPQGKHTTVKDYIRATLCTPESNETKKVVDVWCEAGDPKKREEWNETVDSLTKLEGLDYHYVIGCHPHDAENYTDELEAAFSEAHARTECVGWGEIGLDYHYDNSPREIQKDVLRRQLRASLKSGLDKAITIHTREADEDIYEILTSELPSSIRIHVHCFTDSPALATKLLDFFPNLYIGVTGVVTFSSNLNTPEVLRNMLSRQGEAQPRFLLETDAPYMPPSNLGPNSALGMTSKQKFPFNHSGTLPWTAEFIAKILNEGAGAKEDAAEWDTIKVLQAARENCRKVYRI